MGRAKVVAPRLAKSTTLLSRRQKPMPPNVRWRLSANRLDSSFIARTRRASSNTHPHCSHPLQIHHHSRVLVYTPTTRRQFLDRRITMGADTWAPSLNSFGAIRQKPKNML